VYFTAAGSGNNQTFSNTVLASYASNTDVTLFYNGSLLENTYYTLSGDTLTVNTLLATGDTIDIIQQVANAVAVTPNSYGNANVLAYLNAGIASNIIPSANNAFSLGNATNQWASLYVGANITANYFIGNGSTLSSITGANVSGIVAQANIANTANIATIANTAYSVAGANVSGIVAQANIANTANTAYSVAGANVSGQVANALTAGTVYANAQPNITTVGTLTSLSVTGNTQSGNLRTGGSISATGNISANTYTGNGSQLTGVANVASVQRVLGLTMIYGGR
jgi:hypothetical protein